MAFQTESVQNTKKLISLADQVIRPKNASRKALVTFSVESQALYFEILMLPMET